MTTRLPDVPTGLDEKTTDFLRAVRDVIERREGLTDDKSAAFVAKADLGVSWKSTDLLDSWVRYAETQEAAAFFKAVDGTVYIKGTVAGGSTGAAARVFILPPGYRPAYKIVVAVITNTGIGQVDIEPTGEVRPVSGGTTWFSLSGITFMASP